MGSGVVVAPGRVLTNAHNLRHDEATVTFADGRTETARVAGSDADLDIAVLEVDTGDTEPVGWAPDDRAAVEIGRLVFALGNPGGRGLRVTPGFVSSAARSFRGPRGRRIAGAIEHTAPLPRGSSGGPLLGADGELLGINSVRVDGGLILAIRPTPRSAIASRRSAAARPPVPSCGLAWRSRRPGSPGGCAGPSDWPSATACSSAGSRAAAPPSGAGSSAAI